MDDYRLTRILGVGGFGITFEAIYKEGEPDQDTVALKVIHDVVLFKKNEQGEEEYYIKSYYRDEATFLEIIKKDILDTGISPNFVYPKNLTSISLQDFDLEKHFPQEIAEYRDSDADEETEKSKRAKTRKIKDLQKFKEDIDYEIETAEQYLDSTQQKNLQIHFIAMEKAQVTALSDVLSYHGKMNLKYDRDTVRSYIFQMLSALTAMQVTNIQHRDIKSGNIIAIRRETREQKHGYRGINRWVYANKTFFIEEADQALIPLFIDYSLSEKLETNDPIKLERPVGTIFNRPPENVFLTTNPPIYNVASELFALATAILDMFGGVEDYIIKRIKKEKKIKKQTIDYFCSRNLKKDTLGHKFICRDTDIIVYTQGLFDLLGKPPEEYLDIIKETKFHKFFIDKVKDPYQGVQLEDDQNITRFLDEDGQHLLRTMLAWDPKQRSNPFELITTHPYFASIRKQNTQTQKEKEVSYFGVVITEKNKEAQTYTLETPGAQDIIEYKVVADPVVKDEIIGKEISQPSASPIISSFKTKYYHGLAKRRKLVIQLPGEPASNILNKNFNIAVECPACFPTGTLCWKSTK